MFFVVQKAHDPGETEIAKVDNDFQIGVVEIEAARIIHVHLAQDLFRIQVPIDPACVVAEPDNRPSLDQVLGLGPDQLPARQPLILTRIFQDKIEQGWQPIVSREQ